MMTVDLAQTLMVDFADSTGVSGKTTLRRYLWTDAFAVCNFLGLSRQFDDDCYLELAQRLVDQVHHILGRHRDDDPRSGWISGLPEEEGKRHPTRGGLRIGKTLNERGPDQPPDSDLEWDRDGQYFHYLTKWIHALHRVAQETGENRYQRWAVELAVTAHDAFTYEASPDGPKRMVWKMSIDLSRPLVSSMGHHDPLDGLITYLELQTAEQFDAGNEADLTRAIAETAQMCEETRWATDDPLGIGGLLDDATRLAQMVFQRRLERHRLLRKLLAEAESSLRSFARSPLLSYSAQRRLAFRELGLSIGVQGLTRIKSLVKQDGELTALVDDLLAYRPIAEQIQTFWSDPAHRRSSTWTDHRDINAVMLATSIAPQGYLQL
jgi:hypothetical protein